LNWSVVTLQMAAATAQKKKAAVGIAVLERTKGERIKLADAISEHKTEIKEHKAKRTHVA
jgi:hypothetical protein